MCIRDRVSIFIEPAKVLFLNNAINHGIFNPIGVSQAAEAGRSIICLLYTSVFCDVPV